MIFGLSLIAALEPERCLRSMSRRSRALQVSFDTRLALENMKLK
jgi:hypothetical protein